MIEVPKCISAKVLSDNILQLGFENGEKRVLHTHFIGGNRTKKFLFGVFSSNSFHKKIEIKKDGSLILNDTDVYSTEELWFNSERIFEKMPSNKIGGAQMRAKLGNTNVEVWKISEETPNIHWIKDAFKKTNLVVIQE